MSEHHHSDDDTHQLRRIADTLEKLYHLLLHAANEDSSPTKIEVKWKIEGKYMSTSSLPLNLNATSNAVGSVTELNSDGSVFVFNPASIQAVAQDPTIVGVVVSPTNGAITVTPLKVGSTSVAVQDSATGVVSPTYTFTVTQSTTGPTPSSLSVSWAVTP
jgi:hypothetical protein